MILYCNNSQIQMVIFIDLQIGHELYSPGEISERTAEHLVQNPSQPKTEELYVHPLNNIASRLPKDNESDLTNTVCKQIYCCRFVSGVVNTEKKTSLGILHPAQNITF